MPSVLRRVALRAAFATARSRAVAAAVKSIGGRKPYIISDGSAAAAGGGVPSDGRGASDRRDADGDPAADAPSTVGFGAAAIPRAVSLFAEPRRPAGSGRGKVPPTFRDSKVNSSSALQAPSSPPYRHARGDVSEAEVAEAVKAAISSVDAEEAGVLRCVEAEAEEAVFLVRMRDWALRRPGAFLQRIPVLCVRV
jgi:hypothetical protein